MQTAKFANLDDTTKGLEKGSRFGDRLRLFNLATQGILSSAAPTLVASRPVLARLDKLQSDCISDCVIWQKAPTTSWSDWHRAKKKWAEAQIKVKWSKALVKRQSEYYLHCSRHPDDWAAKAMTWNPPQRLQLLRRLNWNSLARPPGA